MIEQAPKMSFKGEGLFEKLLILGVRTLWMVPYSEKLWRGFNLTIWLFFFKFGDGGKSSLNFANLTS